MTAYDLIFADSAKQDLDRLHEFASDIDAEMAERMLQKIASALQVLNHHPYTCRKVQNAEFGSSLRELIIDFRSSGYLALFEILDGKTVLVLAVRHQRESDYH